MIQEAIEWLITPCPPWARRMGYLSESIAIRHRARRCAAHWSAHQANTRDAILGAGPCLDLPVIDLARQFDKVTLVDAVRPRGLRLPPNVDYITMDIHGLAEALASGRSERDAPPLENVTPSDLTVSVNLLSQLPSLPRRAMRRRAPIDDQDAARVSAKIMTEHIRDLSARDGARLLIADAEHRVMGADGVIAGTRDITGDLPLGEPSETWVWPIAPPGERRDGLVEETTVGVWHL